MYLYYIIGGTVMPAHCRTAPLGKMTRVTLGGVKVSMSTVICFIPLNQSVKSCGIWLL